MYNLKKVHCIYVYYIAKPRANTLLFMQIIFYCMTYIYISHAYTGTILESQRENLKCSLDNNMHTFHDLQLLNCSNLSNAFIKVAIPPQHCYIHSD